MKPPLPFIAAAAILPLAPLAVFSFGLIALMKATSSRKPSDSGAATNLATAPDSSLETQLSRLREELHLTAQQDTLWRIAENKEWNNRGAQTDRIREAHAKVTKMAEQPAPDVDAIVALIKDTDHGDSAREDACRICWTALYEALDEQQKAKARPLLENRITSAGQR